MFHFKNLHKIQTYEFSIKTQRPKNSILNNAKIKHSFHLKLNHWQTELEKVIHEA